MPALFIALFFFLFQSHMTVTGLGLILFPPRSEKSLIFLYFHFIFLIERLWNMLTLSLWSLNLVTLIQGKIPSEQQWIDDQICIFALQSVFVCDTCNLGKNPCLPWRQVQMNTIFLLKFSEANNWYINIFYFIICYYIMPNITTNHAITYTNYHTRLNFVWIIVSYM